MNKVLKSLMKIFVPVAFINWMYNLGCYCFIKCLKGVGKVGWGATFMPGFTVFNGSKMVEIGSNVSLVDAMINAGDTPNGRVVIEDNVLFGHEVALLARGHDYKKLGLERHFAITEKSIYIRQGAWIGSRAIIIGGVEIGENSVVAAGSVVTKSVPPNCIYGGNPAKFIKKIN